MRVPEVVRPVRPGDVDYEAAEHRRQLAKPLNDMLTATLVSVPSRSFCDGDTTVSSSTPVSVSGMAQSVAPQVHGSLDVIGSLYVAELDPGQLMVRVVEGADVLWTVTVQAQGAALRTSGGVSQLSRWCVPIFAPGILDVVARVTYALDVEIAAPIGSYRVLAGSGKESCLSVELRPLFGG